METQSEQKKSIGFDHDKQPKNQWKILCFTKKIDPIENICGIAKYKSMINMNLKIYESAAHFYFTFFFDYWSKNNIIVQFQACKRIEFSKTRKK